MGGFKRRENNFRDRDSDRRGPRDYSSSRGGFRDRDSSRSRGMFDRDSGRNRFDRDSEFKPHRPRDGPRRQPLEMFTVICDKCGKECEVPFKPTSNKPVYCRECFGKEGGDSGPRGRRSSGITAEQFEMLNRKLDKIMKALNLD